VTTENTPDSIYAAPAKWVASGTGAQGNLFLTGRAGTGKTTMLRKFLAGAGEKAIVLAPTGVAAMNAGGQTIHSFFKFPPRLIEPTDIKRLRSTRLVKAIDTMIIDEISMVRSDMLDAIDKSLKLNRASKRPFGGVRMILSGEPRFLALLGALRTGRVTPNDAAVLRGLVSSKSAVEASETHVVLTPNNANAYRINQARLEGLNTRSQIFEADVQGQFEEKAFPTEADLELKEGARVMLIKNDPEGRWVNGTLATVAGFSGSRVIVEIDDHVYEIEPTAWEKYRYELDPETKKVKREVVGTFKQMPLRLAYAVTIHKAQGLTLDKVFIDFDSGMFAHGQAYVAFSRARSLDGLSISRELRPRDLVLDRDAFAFGKLDTIEDTDAYLLAKFATAEDQLL